MKAVLLPDYLAEDIGDLTPAEMLETAKHLEGDARALRRWVKAHGRKRPALRMLPPERARWN